MQMNPGDKSAIFNFMKKTGYLGFFKGLVEIADDRAELLKLTDENKAELRQWQRLERKLEDLARWCELFGPGSGCR
jgi:hypothetical protein